MKLGWSTPLRSSDRIEWRMYLGSDCIPSQWFGMVVKWDGLYESQVWRVSAEAWITVGVFPKLRTAKQECERAFLVECL